MAADLRLHDNAYWRERWDKAFRAYGLSEKERENFGATETDLTDLEESVRVIETWNGKWSTLVELVEALHSNMMLYPLLRQQEGAVRNRLLTLARHVLEVTPVESWVRERYRHEREDGLEPLPYSPIGEGIVAWEQLRGGQVGLSLEVSLALFLLYSLDETGFFSWLDYEGHPVKRKIAADRHTDDADLGLTLAASRSQAAASLGVHHALHYLTLLETYGQQPYRDLDPYTYEDADLETAVAHRKDVILEIFDAVTSLAEAVAQAGHSFLLGQMLGLATRAPSQYLSAGVQQALVEKVPPVIATSLNDLNEDAVWRGIRSVSECCEVAEHIAALSTPEVGLRWRKRIKERLDTLLVTAGDVEAKPIHFRTYPQLNQFLNDVSNCLYSLDQFDLITWFENHFETLEPFRDRWKDAGWSRRSSRAALLTMIGGAFCTVYPEYPAREKLITLLTNQLTRHLPAWQWQKSFHYTDASLPSIPLEAHAITVLGELPSTLKAVYSGLTSVWLGTSLTGEHKDKMQALARHYLKGELPTLSSPMLARLAEVFLHLELYDEAEVVLKWWRAKNGALMETHYPTDALDLFDALLTLGRDETKGGFELEQFARRCEHMRARPSLYEKALATLCDSGAEQWNAKLTKVRQFLVADD